MIDPDNLRTASLYINNQLLSRGLLHDGQTIDFADPESSDGSLQTTMGRIINVVNDLILRRDRDAEHRESLSSTLRTLRTDAQRQTTEYARQTERLEDMQRRLDTAEATERALRAQLRTAEQGIHRLKDEMAKMKSVVAQTRNACANEVRKRDRHIDSLKKAVADAGRVRGGGRNRDVITINVAGDVGSEADEGKGMPVGATEDEGYSLSMETNGFLTELARGLSEENEGLLTLVRHTINGLREMSGFDRDTNAGDEQNHNNGACNEFVEQLPQKSADELAAELKAIAEHLRSILTNPSFVPIEEVEVRDHEIAVLRAGLKTIEARWKDTMLMIDGWRRRMASSGKSVDMEDLQMSLRLSPVRVCDVRDVGESANVKPLRLSCVQEEDEEEEEEDNGQVEKPEPQRQSSAESLHLVPAPQYEDEELDEDSDSDSSIFQDDLDDPDDEEPNVQILQISTADSIDSSPLPEPPKISPLKASYSSGNRGAVSTASPYNKRPGDFSTIVEENTWDLAAAGEQQTPVPASPSQKSNNSFLQVDEAGMPIYTASYDSPLFGKSGEKPAEADLNRKLFSKPSEPRPRSTAIGTVISQRSQTSSPVTTRTTRSSAKRAADVSPAPSIRTVVDTDEETAPSTTTTTSAATSTNASTISTSTTAAAIATTTAPPPPPTTTKTKKQAPQQKTTSTKPSASSNESDKDKSRNNSRDRSGYRKPNSTRSPTRTQSNTTATTAPTPVSSRLPRRHAQQQQQQNPLNMATIAAKLAASEREADAARVRAKLRAVRRSRRISGKGVDSPSTTQGQQAKTRAEAKTQPAENTDTAAANSPLPREEDVDPVKKNIHREEVGDTSLAPTPVPTPIPSPNPRGMKRAPRRRLSRAPVGDDVDELGVDDASSHLNGYEEDRQEQEAVEGRQEERERENRREKERERETSRGREGRRERGGAGAGAGAGAGGGVGLQVVKNRKITTTRNTATQARAAARADKVASRRRSTLSPWELQGLISGKVESPAKARVKARR